MIQEVPQACILLSYTSVLLHITGDRFSKIYIYSGIFY